MSKERIRVLHVVDSLDLGGAQTFLLGLFRAFNDERFELSVAALHGPGVFSQRFADHGAEPIHLARSKFNPAIPFRLRGAIRAGRYEIIHAHLVPSCFLCERLRGFLGVRRCVSHLHMLYRKQQGHEYQNFLERLIYKKSDFLLGCSQAVLAGVPTSVPSRVVYNGVDEGRFRPPTPEIRASVRRELGFSPTDFVVGATGRMDRRKSQALLCRMAASLAGEIPSLQLLLVGSGPLEKELRRLAAELRIEDRVVFAGYQSQVERFLAAMDVFALTSEAEGHPLSLIEAMASGLGCVVSDFEGCEEIIRPGVDALQFPRGDVQALAERVRKFHGEEQLRGRCGQAARQKVLEKFSEKATARSVAEVYEELLGMKPAPKSGG